MEHRRVLIVEDHPLVSDATFDLMSGLAEDLQCVQAFDARSALELLDTPGWSLVLLDLDVPGAQGMSLARRVADQGLAPRSCIVSAFAKPAYVAEARALGFRGYVLKTYPTELFTASLRLVLGGEPSYPTAERSAQAGVPRLTRKQLEVLQRVAQGMSSKQVGRALHISEGTVNNHLVAVLQVLGVTSRLAACRRAHELGLIELGSTSGTDA